MVSFFEIPIGKHHERDKMVSFSEIPIGKHHFLEAKWIKMVSCFEGARFFLPTKLRFQVLIQRSWGTEIGESF